MTIQEAVKQLEEMRDHPMMPVVFKPFFDKVIETIADEFAPTKDGIYWGYTVTVDRPLADKEIVFRLRAIQKQIGGSYAIDRAIEVIEEVQELSERHSHVADGNKIDRQAAIDLVEDLETKRLRGDIGLLYAPTIKGLRALPPAQPEHDDEVTFWEERANEYEAMLGELMTKIAKGMTVDSIVINKDEIVFKESQPEQRWIPVTLETLPNLNSVVVVCGRKGTWDYGTYRGWYGDIHSWQWKKNTIKHVYWWMYKTDALPEPYKEKNNG